MTVDPSRLALAGLTLMDLERALAENNQNFGGPYTESRGERFVIRGMVGWRGRTRSPMCRWALPGRTPIRLGMWRKWARTPPPPGAVTYNGTARW